MDKPQEQLLLHGGGGGGGHGLYILYGVKVKDCMVKIHYEAFSGTSWDIPTVTDDGDTKVITFATNNQNDSLNFVKL